MKKRSLLLFVFMLFILIPVTSVFAEQRSDFVDAGDQISHDVNGINFYMRLSPASTFPMGLQDSWTATIDYNFWVAETPVTYELWYEVRMWALDNGYTFANAGLEGSTTGGGDWPDFNAIGKPPTDLKQEPATMMNWYDCLVWCNALSEYLEYDPVYTMDGDIVKNAEQLTEENAMGEIVAEDRDGFRLPTSIEWELAARYRGSDSSHDAIEYPEGSGRYWTPGNYASGATAPAWIGPFLGGEFGDIEATREAAWFIDNSQGKTQTVGQKPKGGNALGIYDMSGNVWEWCFTWSESNCFDRGGCWSSSPLYMQVGFVFGNPPDMVGFSGGIRFVRTQSF